MSHRTLQLLICLIVAVVVSPLWAQEGRHPDLPDPDFSMHSLFFTRDDLVGPEFMEFLREARPQYVQAGYYGPMLHGWGDNVRSTGYPIRLPMVGQKQVLRFQTQMNKDIHELGLKVIGHFQMGKTIGSWEHQTDFIDWYTNRWDEELLGPKPHPDVLEIVEQAEGRPIETGRYNTVMYVGLCASSPHTRQMLKQMLKVAIDAGVDGIQSNYNYRSDCVCDHCQDSLRKYLADRFTAEQLQERFAIADIKDHHFEEIPAKIPGYPEPDAPALHWEIKRWGAINFKEAFDEVYIDYGRSLKPDLVIATWNHLSNLSIREERAFLPIELWGKGENYFWYSGGAAFVNKNLNLKEHKAGDAWLAAYYIRELSGGKPFVLGKYDKIRMRANIAEGVATGGAGMGQTMAYRTPGSENSVQYTTFVNARAEMYDHARPHGEVALVLPRQSLQWGHAETMDAFRSVGQSLIEDQILIDVVADQKMSAERLAHYPLTIVPDARCLTDAQWQALEAHGRAGGVMLLLGQPGSFDGENQPRQQTLAAALEGLANVTHVAEFDAADMPGQVADLLPDHSRIEAPWTLRAGSFTQDGRQLLHLVNYNRGEEKAAAIGRRAGAEAEFPLPEKDVAVDLRLASEAAVSKVLLHLPEQDEASELSFEQSERRLRFSVPELLVYAVIEIRHE